MSGKGDKRSSGKGDDRSVKAREIKESIVVTGDKNKVSTKMTWYNLPLPDKVDAKAELAALHELVGRIVKYAKAADDFDEHVTKLLPHIAALGSWLGTAGDALLRLAGIAP